MPNDIKIYRTPAAAERMGISVSTLEKWRHQGIGPKFLKIGRRVVAYRAEDLDEFIGQGRTSTVSSLNGALDEADRDAATAHPAGSSGPNHDPPPAAKAGSRGKRGGTRS